MNHTPEPWVNKKQTYEPSIHGPDGVGVACCINAREQANGMRIVACVNGCKGISDPENMVPELVAVLKGLFEHCAMPHKHWGEGSNQAEATAFTTRGEALLSKLEGVTK